VVDEVIVVVRNLLRRWHRVAYMMTSCGVSMAKDCSLWVCACVCVLVCYLCVQKN